MSPDLTTLKQRYGIIGHSTALDYAINIAVQVAPTDLSVLILGESGVGKESFPKIIHDQSACKHGPYIAVNCGAIPEGTIDSELFGHEKGSFTGATDSRKGYFEVANGGTIFLDEVADLPLATQVRLLRVLETGDFMKVGSSKVEKTKVRVVAATNVNIGDRISKGKFREDLYYRLNTVPIHVPPLCDRQDDVVLLFTKFSYDFAMKYRFPQLELTLDAIDTLKNYRWPGNIRQLKNVTEQMSLIEQNRLIDAFTLQKYISTNTVSSVPALINTATAETDKNDNFERELIFKFLADMKREVTELKGLVNNITTQYPPVHNVDGTTTIDLGEHREHTQQKALNYSKNSKDQVVDYDEPFEEPIILEENFSLIESEKEMIRRALEKHGNKRKLAADELGISERTLYRRIKDLGL
ncbi:MAG: sigma-54 dependent transcriptional regulator [Bacteroidales bacterium]|jgi:transcriptional regulator with PAS, ATPase and Fis domain|nr:sigma-54 dependent transcriptional regulator [Bacteroidales bacterium]